MNYITIPYALTASPQKIALTILHNYRLTLMTLKKYVWCLSFFTAKVL